MKKDNLDSLMCPKVVRDLLALDMLIFERRDCRVTL